MKKTIQTEKKAIIFLMLCLLTVPAAGIMAQSKIPDYSQTGRKDIPAEYTWNVEDIYKGMAEWEADRNSVKEEIAGIEKQKGSWLRDGKSMADFYLNLSGVLMKLEKLSAYAARQQHADLGNSLFRKMSGEVQSLYIDLNTRISFIEPGILKLGSKKFNAFLNQDKRLKDYQFTIERILRKKDHILPSDKEDIVSLTELFSGSAEQAASLLNNLEIQPADVTLSDGRKVKLNYATYSQYRASKNSADRTLVMKAFWDNHKKYENTIAVLLDAEMKAQYFNAKVHNYPTCLQASLFPNGIDTAVYYQLISSVNNNLEPLHKYLKLKRELLGQDKFRYEDIYASSVKAVDKTFSFDEAKELSYESLKPLGSEYQTALAKAFDGRWIDIYPNDGKESGAYSEGLYTVHPYIKLNYIGTYDAVSTLVHELGHAIHSYLTSKNQPHEKSNYTTFVAEIASTFNENLLMDQMLKNEKDDLFKLYVLDSFLDGIRATIYRQTLFAEFELEMHKKIEAGGSLTPDWLNDLYLNLTRKYYGHDKGVTEVGSYIQNEWSNIPHFYLNYYVYQYSTGLIASMALSDIVLKGGEKERDRYLNLLKSGGNGFPIEQVKLAGLDMSKKEAMEAGLNRFSNLVDEMEKIVEKLKKENRI